MTVCFVRYDVVCVFEMQNHISKQERGVCNTSDLISTNLNFVLLYVKE